ncbi:MAG: IS4 family transposase [Candidatus Hydrogenedentes bacterium]|nr:IS4 family transposase [Candidatus Hydrogenedentota bacterium]
MEEALDWAHGQFWGAHLPDLRLRRRLVEVAACLREHPCGTLPRALGNEAATKAAYRLFSHDSVTHEEVLRAHVERTRGVCRNAGEFLLIEDTTALSFSQRDSIAGMGPMSNKGSQGLLVHTCLAAKVAQWSATYEPEVTLEGLFSQECWAREAPDGTRKDRKKAKRKSVKRSVPRESDRWGRALRGTDGPPGSSRWALVADRECDIFEVMADCGERNIDWVLRAAQRRKTLPLEQDIFEAIAQAPVLGVYGLDLRARPSVTARRAQVEVRSLNAAIRPKREFQSRYAPLQTGLVEVREVDPPNEQDAVHWVLLSSWPCDTFAHARRVIGAYACRWLIEEYHKALKTGTNIEDSQLSTADRIKPLLAIHAVIAVELLQLKLIANTHPDDPISEESIPAESLKVLGIKYGRPINGWTNRTLMNTIARIGGYLNRKNDGPPGWLSIWRGWKRLSDMTQGYILATQLNTYV